MSLDTPTISEISEAIIAQLEARLNQTVPALPKSFLRTLSKVLAGVFVLAYKYAGFSFLQIFVATATGRATEVNGSSVRPLVEWGRLIGIGDPTPATQAELTVEISVTNQTGSLPSGQQLVSPVTGVTYLTLSSVALDAATKTVNVRAVADQSGGDGSGAIGNLDVGSTMAFANPLPNVESSAEVTAIVATGAAGETETAYRQRVLDRFRKRPQGGAPADYALWGSEAAGVLNVYPYKSDLPGRVDVYVESSTETDGVPTTAQLQAALDAIVYDDSGLASRRPTNDLVNAYPIDRLAFSVTVAGLDVEDEGQVQTDIQAALAEYFRSREPYIVGLSAKPRNDRITSSSIGSAVDDIVSAAGGIVGAVYVSQSGLQFDVYTLGVGQKAKLGTLSFV